jgi:Fic family protein
VTSTLSGEKVRAFLPPPLPPDPRALDLASLQAILAEANQAIGRLDGTTSSLPDLKLFLYSYVRKEAVLSSQIEGTQAFAYQCVYTLGVFECFARLRA